MHMHMHAYMTKIISLSDNAYERLKKMKQGKDSFSDVILRLTEANVQAEPLGGLGAWKDMPEMDAILKGILEKRQKRR